jgi:hypothetical protein
MEDLKQKKEHSRLIYLYGIKEQLKNEIVEFRTIYGFIDDVFNREIKLAEINKNKLWFGLWSLCYKQTSVNYLDKANPIILKYYESMFTPI